jgi:hypothetical protein
VDFGLVGDIKATVTTFLKGVSDKTDGFSVRFPGRPWPMPRPMRSARSWAKQVWSGRMDAVIKTMERNVRRV